MFWSGVVAGSILTLFTYCLFTSDEEDNLDDQHEDELEVNDFSTRHVTLSCQTCRKLKRHKEIEQNLFQCVKCKRHIDIRKTS